MQNTSPQLAVFSACYVAGAAALGKDNIYDYLPGKVSYPFAYIGEQFNNDIPNKTAVFGQTTQTIHFYMDDVRKRGTLLKVVDEFVRGIRSIQEFNGYKLNVIRTNSTIMQQSELGTEVLHVVLDVTIQFT